MNTRNSALRAIDSTFNITIIFTYHENSASPFLYQDLHERIQGALQEKGYIELDLAQPEVRTDAMLRAILKRNQRENHETLTKFIDQFVNFGRLPHECREGAHHLRKSIAANARPGNVKHRILSWKWAQEPEVASGIESNNRAKASHPLVLKDLGGFAVDGSKRCLAKLPKRRE